MTKIEFANALSADHVPSNTSGETWLDVLIRDPIATLRSIIRSVRTLFMGKIY